MFLIPLILIQAVIFAGFVFFLRKILSRNVVSATAHLDKMVSEYARKEEEIKTQYEEAQKKSQEIVVNAQKEIEQQKEQIIREAQDEKKKIMDIAHVKAQEMLLQADNARQALLKEIHQQIEEKALDKALELLGAVLPEGIRKEIHKNWAGDLISNGLGELERLKIPDSINEASVTTPFALDEKQRNLLLAKLSEKLNRHVRLNEKVDPCLLAGILIHIASVVFDGSLRFKIQEAARAQRSGI